MAPVTYQGWPEVSFQSQRRASWHCHWLHCVMLHNRNLLLEFPPSLHPPLPYSGPSPWPLPGSEPGWVLRDLLPSPSSAVLALLRAAGLWPDACWAKTACWWPTLASSDHRLLASWLRPSCQVQLYWESSSLSFSFLCFTLMVPSCQTWWVMGLRNQMISHCSNLSSLSQAERRAWGQTRRKYQTSTYTAMSTVSMKVTSFQRCC